MLLIVLLTKIFPYFELKFAISLAASYHVIFCIILLLLSFSKKPPEAPKLTNYIHKIAFRHHTYISTILILSVVFLLKYSLVIIKKECIVVGYESGYVIIIHRSMDVVLRPSIMHSVAICRLFQVLILTLNVRVNQLHVINYLLGLNILPSLIPYFSVQQDLTRVTARPTL